MAEILGDKPKIPIGSPGTPSVLARHVNADGTIEPESMKVGDVIGPDGKVRQIAQAIIGRHAIIDAEELVEMIADRVVEKLHEDEQHNSA